VENWTVPGEDGFQASADFVAETRKHAAKINQAIRKVFWSLLFKGVMVFHKSSAKRLGRCHWPFKSMFVSVEGLVTPCCIRMHRGHALGNIFEKGSLDEIWNSEQYKALRRNHMCQKGPDTICAQCPN
jgi:radical SAM protein with 4Fe4S-binding SPASM domain